MSFQTVRQRRFIPILICLIITFTSFCSQKDVYEGIYKAVDIEDSKHAGGQIELMEKGQAIWRVADDETSFRWDVKGSELWLSTKSGGIIIGKIHGDIITITLPGEKKMSFKKM